MATLQNRTYHDADSPYMIPNDSLEHVRLDRQSLAMKALIGNRASIVPSTNINAPQKVLDVGCGSGFTTIDLAQHYPNSIVYGLDLSDVPEAAKRRAPSNIVWLKGNFLKDLSQFEDSSGNRIFEPGTFTHVFARALIYGIEDWGTLDARCYELLAPGGWLERLDPNME